MNRTIEISDDLFDQLTDLAEAPEETPEQTLRRIIASNGRPRPSVRLGNVDWPQHTQVKVTLEILSDLNVSAYMARRLAQRFLLTRVGHLVRAEEPTLVVGQPWCWEVPAVLTNPEVGCVGEIGRLRVDAETGEILAGRREIEEMKENARRLVGSSAP